MTNENVSKRVEAILERLRDCPDEERRAVLERERLNDPEVCAEVESILGFTDPSTVIELGRQITDELTAALLSDKRLVGKRLGDYEVLEEIGSGGMGVVFKAHQVSLNRIVALKMIKGGSASANDLLRFGTEAKAVARLEHENIVRLYQVENTDGQPMFVMEFVEGGSLADDLKEATWPAHRSAELIEQLARAMHFAHQRGIIHRDLKPGNILLTSEGVAKIADFGLAKRTDVPSAQTQTGVVIGTPSYMAPEQAAGQNKEITAAADLYALGAILYELLTGKPPFRADSVLETLSQVISTEPVPPRKLQPKIPRDLETICLKCLRKECLKRYCTGAELADDLRRFLDGKPILAQPVGAVEKTVKWARRKAALASLVTVIVLSVLSLLGGGGWFNINLQAALTETQKERDEAKRQRDKAGVRLEWAQEAVDKMLSRVGEKHLAYIPQVDEVRRQLLQDALEFNERFLQEKRNDPKIRWQVARANGRVGIIQQMLGKHLPAESALKEGSTILTRLIKEFPSNADYPRDLSLAHKQLGRLAETVGQHEKAEMHYRSALNLRQQLLSRYPNESIHKREMAIDFEELALLLELLGQDRKAVDLHLKARKLRRELVKQFPHRGEYLQELAIASANIGRLQQYAGALNEAERAFCQALDFGRQARQLVSDRPDYLVHYVRTCHNLSVVLRETDRADHAADVMLQATKTAQKLATAYPLRPEYQEPLAKCHTNLGNAYETAKRWAEAEKQYQASIDLQKKLLAAYPRGVEYKNQLAIGYYNLGSVLRRLKNLPAANQATARAIELFEELVRVSPNRIDFRTGLAGGYTKLGVLQGEYLVQPAAAVKSTRKAVKLWEALYKKVANRPAIQRELGVSYYNLAVFLEYLKQPDAAKEAEKSYLKAHGIQDDLVNKFPKHRQYRQDLISTCRNLGHVMKETGRPAEMLKYAAQAARLMHIDKLEQKARRKSGTK